VIVRVGVISGFEGVTVGGGEVGAGVLLNSV
jgi:hypothetical protein